MRRDRENWREKRARLGKRGGVITPALLPDHAGLILVWLVLATSRLLSGTGYIRISCGVLYARSRREGRLSRSKYHPPNLPGSNTELHMCRTRTQIVISKPRPCMQIFFLLKYYIVHVGCEPHLSHPTIPIIYNSQYIPTCAPIVGKSNHFFLVPSLYTNTKLRGSNSASSRPSLFRKDNKNNHPQICTFYLNPG